MISWARGAPSVGGGGSGARCSRVAEEEDDENEDRLCCCCCCCCKLGGAGTAEEVVVTFGLLLLVPWRGELASERDEVVAGSARRISGGDDGMAVRRLAPLPPFAAPFTDAVAEVCTPARAEPCPAGDAYDLSAAADAENKVRRAAGAAARSAPTAKERWPVSGERRIFYCFCSFVSFLFSFRLHSERERRATSRR